MSFENTPHAQDPVLLEPDDDTGTWQDPALVQAVQEMKRRMGLVEHTEDASEPEA